MRCFLFCWGSSTTSGWNTRINMSSFSQWGNWSPTDRDAVRFNIVEPFFLALIFIKAPLTLSFDSFINFLTLANFHRPLGYGSLKTKTMSPTKTFSLCCDLLAYIYLWESLSWSKILMPPSLPDVIKDIVLLLHPLVWILKGHDPLHLHHQKQMCLASWILTNKSVSGMEWGNPPGLQ